MLKEIKGERGRGQKRREEKGSLGFPLVGLGVIPLGLDH